MKKFSFGISFRSNYLQTDLHSAFMKNCRVDEKFSKPCCIVPPPFNYLQRIYEHSGKKIHIGKNFYKLVSPRTLERYHLISINISTNHHRRNYLERRINLKIIIHYNIENSNREKKISKISSRSTNPTTRISRSNRIEAEKMDGSAHLFQFQLVWGNNEKSGSAISRQFGNNALDRGAISRFRIHESMEEVCFEHRIFQCVRVRVKKREKESNVKKKKDWIDRNEPVAQRAILHGWTTMLDYAILLNGTISMNHNHFPLMSLRGWSIITQYSILKRPFRPEINRNNRCLSELRIPHYFCCFKIRESWWKGRKSEFCIFAYGEWYGNVRVSNY